jgi:hypothetical protein
MIKCEVTGEGKRRKVVLTLPEYSGWFDRFPKVRADNGVIVEWWDFDANKPLENLKWDTKSSTLTLPIPFARERDKMEGVRINVPPSTVPVVLGTLRVSEISANRIYYAIAKMNEYVSESSRFTYNGDRFTYNGDSYPEGMDLLSELVGDSRKKYSSESVAKLGEVIDQLEAEIYTRLDTVSEQMSAIQDARRKIGFLRELQQKWTMTGSDEISDMDVD